MAQVPDSEDEKNITLLGTACPVADRHLLHSPPETRTWVTLKEGYLLKTKFKKLHNSTKLRMFTLKQNPTNLAARLEYYEGLSFRGAASLEAARIHPQKAGVFLVHCKARTFHLQAEKADLRVATSWVLALQQAILSAARGATAAAAPAPPAPSSSSSSSSTTTAAAAPSSPSPSSSSTSPTRPTGAAAAAAMVAAALGTSKDHSAPSSSANSSPTKDKRGRGADEMTAMPSAVDEARWAALRRLMNPHVEVDADSEDVVFLRAAEEEEERRQNEERAAWLSRMKKPSTTTLLSISEEAEEEKEEEQEEEEAVAGSGVAALGRKSSLGGESSGDDDEGMEEEIRMLRLAEEEEERRQQAERAAFLAAQGRSG